MQTEVTEKLMSSSTNPTTPSLEWTKDSRPLSIRKISQNFFGIRRFLKFAYKIYQNDPNWVAPLLIDSYLLLTRKNPFFNHATMTMWFAYRGAEPVGRIAGIVDVHYNRYHNDKAAFFGFFECKPDPEAAKALIDAVSCWARNLGMQRLIGPLNPHTNEVCGLLIQGFDSPPVFMMPYNPPYYPSLLELAGLRKIKDLLAYWIELTPSVLERFNRIANICRRRYPWLSFRTVERQQLDRDLKLIMEVYNAAWEDNWGFVPMTHEEIIFLAKRLKPIFDERFVWIALDNQRPVGFLLGMPDLNVAFRHLRGRLLSPGLFKALPYLLRTRHPEVGRVLTLGVRAGYRNRGIESVLLTEALKQGLPLGYRAAEASWILEDNWAMRNILEDFKARVYKVYRLYVTYLKPDEGKASESRNVTLKPEQDRE